MMSKLSSKAGTPTALLYVFVVWTQVASGIYLASDREPPPVFSLLYVLGFIWIIGWWLLRDSRRRSVRWVYDMGLFLYIAWPFIMLYYLPKTRGVQGVWVILSFAGVYTGALLAGMIMYDLFIR
jgi:hypothetical protein